MTAFDTAQALYDAAQPADYGDCHHDGDLTFYTSDAGTTYLVCCECYESIPDPDDEPTCSACDAECSGH